VDLSTFVLGGARSGKSRFAVSDAPPRGRVAFLATAEPGDADMSTRIARHRAERPKAWRTFEEPIDLVPRLESLVGQADAVIVDCLTLWVSNRLLRAHGDDAILEAAEALAKLITTHPYTLTIVSNEVGQGVHPETADGRRFRDLLGAVNQRVAAVSDRVILMVAGLPLIVKAPVVSHDFGPQNP